MGRALPLTDFAAGQRVLTLASALFWTTAGRWWSAMVLYGIGALFGRERRHANPHTRGRPCHAGGHGRPAGELMPRELALRGLALRAGELSHSLAVASPFLLVVRNPQTAERGHGKPAARRAGPGRVPQAPLASP